jgi:class 3 adenylate cyclase
MDDAGARGAARPADAESRFVALLKFDLVGSTEISNALSPSDELELQRGYTSAVESLVDLHQVKIEWEGDGGLIVFGYPEARVDAAEAAVRTGLKLLEAVQAVRVVPGLRLQVRVGIASGRVTIDKTSGSLRRVQPVSRAARLMDHAQPGQLLLAEDTRRLVRQFFEYEDLGVVELQGAGRRRVWRVVGETAVVSRFAAQRQTDSPGEILGRDDVLAALADAWSATLEGHGSAICLVGDSGMGKSRLARAALDWARRDGAVVLEIDCTPSTGNSPLLPIGVLLRRTAGISATATEDEKRQAATALLTRLLGEAEAIEHFTYLAPLFGIESEPIPMDKTREQVRTETMSAIVGIARALATQSPLTVLCEDLHWADDSTAQVVQAVGAIVSDLPLELIVTRWPKPVTPIDLEAITSGFTIVPVEPLAAATAAHLVRAVAGEGLSPERVDDIVNRCGGVPLLLEEVARSTTDQTDVGIARRAVAHSESAVPPELQLVVESRLQQFPSRRSIIEAASVLGREFPVPLLETLVAGSGDDVREALSHFAEHGLLSAPRPGGGDRASFRHALIRDAVYETLVSKDYLRRLHSRAADTLSSQYVGTPDASPDVLAHHLRAAHRLGEAINIRLAAAEDTFTRGAYVEAMGHCDAVRDLLDEVGDKQAVKIEAFRLCVLRGMVASGVHGFSAAPVEVAYREAERMFDDQTGPDLRYPVIRGLSLASLVRGDLATAYRYSLDGWDLAERSQRPDYRIDAMSVLAYTTMYFGKLEDCRHWIARCLDLYETERGERFRYPVPQDAKTAALALLPTAAWLLGDADGAEQAIARGVEHVDTLARDFDKALLHAWTAGTRYTQRRYAAALQHAQIAYGLGKTHKFQEWEGVGAMLALLSQSALAPSPEAVQHATFTAQAFVVNGIGLNRSYFLWGIARGHVTAGDRAAAQTALQDALSAAAASEETRMNPEIWMLQAELEGEPGKALALLLDAYRLARTQGAIANALRAAATALTHSLEAREWALRALDLLDGRDAAPAGLWMMREIAQAEALLERFHPGAAAT